MRSVWYKCDDCTHRWRSSIMEDDYKECVVCGGLAKRQDLDHA